MRRAQLVLVTVLALGAALVTTASAADDDGTLSVQNAAGTVQVRATGAVIGRIIGVTNQSSTLKITDADTAEGGQLQLFCPDGKQNISAQTQDPDDKTVLCTGENIRFRLVGGAFRLTASGSGINLSVVGKGHVTLTGTSTRGPTGETNTTGTYSVNDGESADMPAAPHSFVLDASATA
jgi:hypothetical protein